MLSKNRRRGGFTLIELMIVIAIIAILAAILVPNFIRARAQGQLTACKSNLKNIGTAMEMYSTDWSGKYPSGAAMLLLTPNYLKTIPECPAAGSITYNALLGSGVAYNSPGFQDYYFISCSGTNHKAVSVPAGYPQYDGISGLIER
jgi:prepilin-type N-terminal cleavage/methylation domain-containing protein